ncbi:MAG: cytochrome c oxidase subunit 3 [Bradymonadaceae bacterium]
MTEQHHPHLVEPYTSLSEQREAATLGMWIFLATELLLFGGLFLAYIVYRYTYPVTFHEMSGHLNIWIGTINTVILLTSSLTMALAVHAIEHDRERPMLGYLAATASLGTVFLILKAYEYYEEWLHGLVPLIQFDFTFQATQPIEPKLFMSLYFAMTGLHAFHLVVGILLISGIAYFGWRGDYSAEYSNPVEIGGLYWHLIDIIWVFLYPLLYLLQPS